MGRLEETLTRVAQQLQDLAQKVDTLVGKQSRAPEVFGNPHGPLCHCEKENENHLRETHPALLPIHLLGL